MSRPSVVILGVNEMALAAARSLRARRIRILAVHCSTEPYAPAAYSRHFDVLRGPDSEHQDALRAFLCKLAERFPSGAVLLPAQDWAVLFLHRYRSELAPRYRFYVWESAVLPDLGSKRGLVPIAARYRLPLPETVAPGNRAELDAAIPGLVFPLLVKPEFTPLWWSESAVRLGLDRKAITVRDAAQLRDVYERSEHVGAKVVVQRIIGGPDSDHWSYGAFVAPDGATKAEIVVRKLRIAPPRFGIGSYVVTVSDDDALRVGREVLRNLGFRGFASVQLKRDAQSARLQLLEINLRLPMWVELAIAAGIDFPFYYYQTCVGEPYATGPAKVGRCWLSTGSDWRSMRVYAREGTWTWWRWLRQWAARPAVPVFRWDDPLPVLVAMSRWLRATLARQLRRNHATR